MKNAIIEITLGVFVVASLAALWYSVEQYRALEGALGRANASQEQTTANSAAQSGKLEDQIKQKDAYITFLEGENADLNNTINTERAKTQRATDQMASQVTQIGQAVTEMQKIQNTDPELLKKYSKVYFLNENYTPAQLAIIPNQYLANKNMTIAVQGQMLPFLDAMIAASEQASTSLTVISGYRSFADQKSLKSTYRVTYGTGANKFSADQGYSEHQLGTAVDLSTVKLGLGYTSFAKDPAYKWMQDNAFKFGFILSYPKGNTSYIFEPWHWRFVGVALATHLHDHDMYFYDMDQRQIDGFISKLFDPAGTN